MPVARTREIQGAQPGSFAIITRRPTACLMAAKMKAQNEAEKHQEELAQKAKLQAYEDLRAEFEDNLNKKLFQKNIMRRVTKLRMGDMINLEVRRENLRKMLSQEEEDLVKEMDQGRETTLERQAKLRAKANELRAKREQERIAIVTDKYEQAFRKNSDEIRGALRHRLELACQNDVVDQIEKNEAKRKEDEKREQMWAEQWENDRKAKEKRETDEAAEKERREKEWAAEVRNQQTKHDEQLAEEKRLEAEEACLLQEQEELMKFEALRDKLEAAKRAADYRKELNLVHKMAVRRELQRQQEELKMDMEMIEKVKREIEEEKQQLSDDKIRLKKELDTYLNYLKELKAQKAIDDCVIEALADAEVARAQKVREDEWERERQKKCRMMQEALDSWNQTLAEKSEENERRKIEIEKGRIAFKEAMAEIEVEEKRKRDEAKHKMECYGWDLRNQADYVKELEAKQQRERDRMYQAGLEEEELYQRKIKYALDHPDMNTVHPVRVKAYRMGWLNDNLLKS